MPEYRFNFATGTVSGHDVSLTQSTMVEVAQSLVLNASAQPSWVVRLNTPGILVTALLQHRFLPTV